MADPPEDRPLQTREVTVNEPKLSPELNAALTDDLRDAVGASQVEVPADRRHVSEGEPVSSEMRGWQPDRFVLMMVGAAGIVIGAIVALLIDHWWVVIPVVLVLWLATYAVLRMVMRMTSVAEKPDPAVEAAMEEEGISDPERHFDALVREFTPDHPEDANERTVAVEDGDHARAAAEQRGSITPGGGRSTPAGP